LNSPRDRFPVSSHGPPSCLIGPCLERIRGKVLAPAHTHWT
jgi:hypothetical protein